MKLIIVILALALNHKVSADSLKIKVIEGYKSEPCTSCVVKVEKNNGEVLFEIGTDNNGFAVFSEIKRKKVRFSAYDSSGNYKKNSVHSSEIRNGEITIIIYPTKEFEHKIWQTEDSLYGSIEESDSDINSNSRVLQREASFPGGGERLSQFIAETVMYPLVSIEMNEMGTVLVSYVVEKNGEISHVKIEKGLSTELDQEAKRVVRAMPKWNTGLVDDESVRVKCYLPINYTLN